ncbi:MAG TPA: nitrile hydratase subunit beta [Dehalococcoidia bacterium]|nr:nitrile hydratase subunit beta [Dehalococcoidia bacterium]
MDGIHDLGGMHGFGPVVREANEPPFHAPWEAAMVAIQHAVGGRGQNLVNIDEFRHGIERMGNAAYLNTSYYEHWLDGVTRVLLEKGVIAAAELEKRADFFTSHPDSPASAALSRPPPPVQRPVQRFMPGTEREPAAPPRFKSGDAVVTRNLHPRGHTRLPRYARGKHGVIHHYHGAHVFPDAHAHGQGEQPQPLYSVRFAAAELFGPVAEPREFVYLDLWEPYLDRA